MTAPLLVSTDLATRDRVAAVIVAALGDEHALTALRALVRTGGLGLLSGGPDVVDASVDRLAAGLGVAEACHREGAATLRPLARALLAGAVLFRAGLYFEVHEVLEAAWRDLAEPERAFVQGLIQVAVAMHHLAHANPRGAVSLFAAGRAKLAPHAPRFVGVDVGALLAGLPPWEAAAASGAWPTEAEPPPFALAGS